MHSTELDRLKGLVVAGVILQYDADRYERVLGKPSQFVGKVTTLEEAAAHWKAADAWQVEEDARLAELASVVGTPSDEPAEKRGRKADNPEVLARKAELEEAKAAWRQAIVDREKNLALMEEYIKNERDRLNKLKIETTYNWDNHVRQCKERIKELK